LHHRSLTRNAKFQARFDRQHTRLAKLDLTVFLHNWMPGLMIVVLAVPQLQGRHPRARSMLGG
jgi:hypothetical protein